MTNLTIKDVEFHFRARAGAAPLKPGVRILGLTATPYFRARAGAAPLKLSARRQPRACKPNFRARAGAAPLKHFGAVDAHAPSGWYFRARAGAAPLKPSRGRLPCRPSLGISAPARARPR